MIAQAMLWFIDWEEHLGWGDTLLIILLMFIFFTVVMCWELVKLEFWFDNKGDNGESK